MTGSTVSNIVTSHAIIVFAHSASGEEKGFKLGASELIAHAK